MRVRAEAAKWVNREGQKHDLVVQEGLKVVIVVDSCVCGTRMSPARDLVLYSSNYKATIMHRDT
jgi:hypothetical protein